MNKLWLGLDLGAAIAAPILHVNNKGQVEFEPHFPQVRPRSEPLRAGRLGVCCPGHRGSYAGHPAALGHRDGDTRGGGPPGSPGGRGRGEGVAPPPGRAPRLPGPGSVWAWLWAPSPAWPQTPSRGPVSSWECGISSFHVQIHLSEFLLPSRVRPRGALVLFLGTFLDPLPEQVLELNSPRAAPRPPQQRASFLEASLGWQTPLPGPNSKHRQLSRLQASGPGSGQPAGVRDPHSCLR